MLLSYCTCACPLCQIKGKPEELNIYSSLHYPIFLFKIPQQPYEMDAEAPSSYSRAYGWLHVGAMTLVIGPCPQYSILTLYKAHSIRSHCHLTKASNFVALVCLFIKKIGGKITYRYICVQK